MLRVLGTCHATPEGDAVGFAWGTNKTGRLIAAGPGDLPPDEVFSIPHNLLPKESGDERIGYWLVTNRGGGFRNHYEATHLLGLPGELIEVPCPSTPVEESRECLLVAGVDAPFSLVNRQIYVQFADGVVAGAFAFAHASADGRSRCQVNTLARPMRLWKDRDALCPIRVSLACGSRWFLPEPVPAPTDLLDLTPTSELISQFVRANGPLGLAAGPSEEQLRSFLHKLAAIADERLLPLHRKRLQTLIQETMENRKHLQVWWESLRGVPEFQKLLLEWKREVADKSMPDWEQQIYKSKGELEDLRKEGDRLTLEVNSLRERAATVHREAVALLADLRPQLPSAAVAEEHVQENGLDTSHLPGAVPAEEHLAGNLKGIGLTGEEARRTGREVLTAVCLGQAVMFEGTLGGVLARCVAESLAARYWVSFQVPVGLITPEVVGAATARASRSDWCLLLVEGINLSDPTAYAPDLVRMLTERCITPDPARRLIVLGTLATGPAALPPWPELTAFGPIICADRLAWSSNTNGKPSRPGQVVDPFNHPPMVVGPDRRDDLKGWLTQLPGSWGELWRRNVLSAYRMLVGWWGSHEQALSSLVASWILPHLRAGGIAWTHELQDALLDLLGEVEWPARLKPHLPEVSVAP